MSFSAFIVCTLSLSNSTISKKQRYSDPYVSGPVRVSCSTKTSFGVKQRVTLRVYALSKGCKPWCKGRARRSPRGNLISWVVAGSKVSTSLMKCCSACAYSRKVRAHACSSAPEHFDLWRLRFIQVMDDHISSTYIMWCAINSVSHGWNKNYSNK